MDHDHGHIRAGGGDAYVALQDIAPGTKLRLKGDILAVVDDNPRDGMWIVVRHLESPAGPVDTGEIHMVMVDEVVSLESE